MKDPADIAKDIKRLELERQKYQHLYDNAKAIARRIYGDDLDAIDARLKYLRNL